MKENLYKNNAHIAFGSNLKEPYQQLKTALSLIADKFEIVKKSAIYETLPLGGPSGQPMVLNAVILISLTNDQLNPNELLKTLNQIEASMGRTREIRWEAKIIDLDILTFNNQIISEESLIVPHLMMMEREFVLAPFCDISPEWQHPISMQSALAALEIVKGQGVEKTELLW